MKAAEASFGEEKAAVLRLRSGQASYRTPKAAFGREILEEGGIC
jgi:hypothetical protein